MSAEQDHGHPPATSTVDADECCVAPSMATPLAGPSTGVGVVTYRVEELDCATEENDLRAVLTPLPGVRSLEFDLVGRRVRVRHELGSPAPIEAGQNLIRETYLSVAFDAGAAWNDTVFVVTYDEHLARGFDRGHPGDGRRGCRAEKDNRREHPWQAEAREPSRRERAQKPAARLRA